VATIDLVAEDADGRVLLVLIHDPTTEPLETLKERVQLSASYAVDGELAEAFPDVQGQPVAIRIDVPAEPRRDLASFVDDLRPRLAAHGIGLVVKILP
jgi:hypothetical protein